MGFWGFDYGIVAMLDDARQRMLRPGGKMMPRRLRLFAAGVESAEARRRVDAWQAPPVPVEQRWLHEHAINARYDQTFAAQDICTPATLVAELDLTRDSADSLAFDDTLPALRDARIDGLAGWFEAELAEGVWLTNSPLIQGSIDRPNAFLPCRQPFAVRAGEDIALSLRIRPRDIQFAWTVTPPGGAKAQRQSTWQGQILNPADLAAGSVAPLHLNLRGKARLAVLALVDGNRTAAQIEQDVLLRHPDLFPTPEAIRSFVKQVLRADTGAGPE